MTYSSLQLQSKEPLPSALQAPAQNALPPVARSGECRRYCRFKTQKRQKEELASTLHGPRLASALHGRHIGLLWA